MLEARTEATEKENTHTRTTRLPGVNSKVLEGMKAVWERADGAEEGHRRSGCASSFSGSLST